MQNDKLHAIYLRLSKDDNKVQEESNSITNQRKLINEYIAKNINVSKENIIEFVDDGYSGTNFNRPAMKRLLDMVQKRKIECILVKDLSRFGRDYVTVGEYLEHVFPFLKIRFIAVNDGLDSDQYINNIPGLEVAYKNLFNEFYSTLLSDNVKKSIYRKRETGECINAAPYGYMKKEGSGNKLYLNPVTAPIVKKVFQLTLQGVNKAEIAKIMNEKEVLTPGDYRKNVKGNLRNGQRIHFWTTATVGRILKNEEYTGVAISGQYRRPEIGKPYAIKVPKEQWIRHENMHPVLVTKGEFLKIRAMQKAPFFIHGKDQGTHSLFTGYVVCAHCGHILQRRIRNDKRASYFCKYNNSNTGRLCSHKSFAEEDIEKIVYPLIMNQIQVLLDIEEITLDAKGKKQIGFLSYHNQKKEYHQATEKLKAKKLKVYQEWKTGEIDEKKYFNTHNMISSQIEEIAEREKSLEGYIKLEQEIDEQESFIKKFMIFADEKKLTREMLEVFVTKIRIWDLKHIEVKLRYEEQFTAIIDMLDQRERAEKSMIG